MSHNLNIQSQDVAYSRKTQLTEPWGIVKLKQNRKHPAMLKQKHQSDRLCKGNKQNVTLDTTRSYVKLEIATLIDQNEDQLTAQVIRNDCILGMAKWVQNYSLWFC